MGGDFAAPLGAWPGAGPDPEPGAAGLSCGGPGPSSLVSAGCHQGRIAGEADGRLGSNLRFGCPAPAVHRALAGARSQNPDAPPGANARRPLNPWLRSPSRGGRIRTGDPLLPKQVRYRTAPRPVYVEGNIPPTGPAGTLLLPYSGESPPLPSPPHSGHGQSLRRVSKEKIPVSCPSLQTNWRA